MSVRDAHLTSCQSNALRSLQAGENLFVTGHAGTGKSFLVRRFACDLDTRKDFPLLASTGVAAVLIGGRTFHSFFGLGTLQGGAEESARRAAGNRNVRYRIRRAEGILIDEVSMLSGETLSAADAVARGVRGDSRPWGGLRVVAVGDFGQLPPVSPDRRKPWAFLDPVWEATAFEPVILRTAVRVEEAYFSALLRAVRQGEVTSDVASFLDSRSAEEAPEDAVRLFPFRDLTERFNLEKLDGIPGSPVEIPTEYRGTREAVAQLRRAAPVPEVLLLKRGAVVMIRVNDPKLRYVNGTMGRVESWDGETVHVRVGRKDFDLEKAVFSYLDGAGDPVATAVNFPLTLAYASTIHKAQGATLDRASVDLHGAWEPGQAYVALSRVRRGEDLFVTRWTRGSLKSDPVVADFYSQGCPADFASRIDYAQ